MTEANQTHVEELFARPAGYRESELQEARRRDEAAEKKRQAEAQAVLFKENTARSLAREKKTAADNDLRAQRKAMLLKAGCGARLLPGCATKAELLVPATVDALTTPAWSINVVCRPCAIKLFLA